MRRATIGTCAEAECPHTNLNLPNLRMQMQGMRRERKVPREREAGERGRAVRSVPCGHGVSWCAVDPPRGVGDRGQDLP